MINESRGEKNAKHLHESKETCKSQLNLILVRTTENSVPVYKMAALGVSFQLLRYFGEILQV